MRIRYIGRIGALFGRNGYALAPCPQASLPAPPLRPPYGSTKRDELSRLRVVCKAGFHGIESSVEGLGYNGFDVSLRFRGSNGVHYIVDDVTEYGEGVRREQIFFRQPVYNGQGTPEEIRKFRRTEVHGWPSLVENGWHEGQRFSGGTQVRITLPGLVSTRAPEPVYEIG